MAVMVKALQIILKTRRPKQFVKKTTHIYKYKNYVSEDFNIKEFNKAVLITKSTLDKTHDGYIQQLLKEFPTLRANAILNKIIEGEEV
jgi:hypothetical protein